MTEGKVVGQMAYADGSRGVIIQIDGQKDKKKLDPEKNVTDEQT